MIRFSQFYLIISLVAVFLSPLHSQESSNAVVVGKVVEHISNEPLNFADVIIYESEARDSSKSTESWHKGTTTNAKGEFELKDIPLGEYFIEVSFLGFDTKRSKTISIKSEDQKIELKKFSLEESIEFLDINAEVVAEKSTYNLAIDRKIYNVEKDIMAETSSATEILNNVPSVSVDYNGAITLRGTPNVTFFINGKPSALMRANPTAYLESIPASTIEYIEVITNPSAKYRPDGAGGIINIVLKGAADGWEGSVQANAGNLDRYNGNVNLNFTKEDVSVFGNYGIRHATTPQDINDVRTEKDGNGNDINNFNRKTDENYKELSQIATAGVIFPAGEGSTIEVSGEYFYLDADNSSSIETVSEDYLDNEKTQYTTDRTFTGFEQEYQVAAAFEHEFEKEDHTLALEVAYGRYDEEEDNLFDSKYSLPGIGEEITHNLIVKGGPMTELAAEYVLPLNNDVEIELGYDGEFITDNISNLSENQGSDGSWIVDPNKTNDFIFTQNRYAGWGTFSKGIEAFRFTVGLRAEQINITSNLVSADSIVPNNYFKWYPSLHLTYELSDFDELQLNFSKRVNRADSDEHNPFAEYDDPQTREVGNPNLKPEVIYSAEFGYQIQKDNFTFIPTLYYRYKEDAFTEIREIVQDTILETKFINLNSQQSAGLEFLVSGNIKESLGLNFSANLFYEELDASNLGYTNKSQFMWDVKLAANIGITKSTFAQLNAYYRSSRITPQGQFEAVPLLNFGLRQDIFKKRASLTFTVSDVFASVEWESTVDTPILYQKTTFGRNSQIFYVGFTYRFGKRFHKKKMEDIKFEDAIDAGKPPPEDEEE